MKAIETVYKGYRFRSRLEARWAVFFDNLGIAWRYEPEGFEFSNGIKYLPDFYLPQVRMFAEVKPEKFTIAEYKKAILLAKGTKKPVLMLIGEPENKPYGAIELVEYGRTDKTGYYFYCLTMYHNYPIDEHRFYCNPGDWSPGGDAYWDDTERAAIAARSARFEHGENGLTSRVGGRG